MGEKRTSEARRNLTFDQIGALAPEAQRKPTLLLGERRISFCELNMNGSGRITSGAFHCRPFGKLATLRIFTHGPWTFLILKR
jgi:hypothetical protein